MLLLNSATSILQLITASTGSISPFVSYADAVVSTGAISFGPTTNTATITAATTTNLVTSPAAGTVRNIQHLSLENTHASTSNAITVQHTDGTNVSILFTVTLLAGESILLDENGVWWYFQANGAQVTASTIPASAWASPSPIGSTTPNTISGTFIGAGTPAPTTSRIATVAGSTTVAPMNIAGGTNLTTIVAGAVENDAINFYLSTNTTDGRARVPAEQTFRLTANGTAFNTISNFFGATSNISLVASAFYEIEIEVYFTKTTAEAVTWTFTNSSAPTSMNIHYEQSPITGIVAPGSTAVGYLSGDIINSTTATQTIVTGSLTTAVNHYARFKIWLTNGTGSNLKIQASCTTASGITPLRGSRWKCQRIPTGNTGTFAA